MSYAYTPGLKIKRQAIVRKSRILPVPGDVLVKENSNVSYDTVVARTYVPGDINLVPISHILGVEPYELPTMLLKKEGDIVKEGELLAISKSFFGLIKTEYISEFSGKIDFLSDVTGMVGIRNLQVPVNLNAYISGKISNVIPKQGVEVVTLASYIQGIFGIGGEEHGVLMTIADPDQELTVNLLGKDCNGKILVGGSLVTSDFLNKAKTAGVIGIVTGGIKRADLVNILGYGMGVAITGQEDIGLTCIITEGFGKMKMANYTYSLLKSLDGRHASINGATQIRAGVIRPEIIVPMNTEEMSTFKEEEESLAEGMYVGTKIRIIRRPYFGAIGIIASLTEKLQKLETESYVRVMMVKLEDGRLVTIPRANAEIME